MADFSKNKKYRECVAEVEAILKKYDMGGAITVISQDRAMFKYVWPTWGCMSFEGHNTIRFKAKREDYPSEEAQYHTMELSVHVIMQMKDIAANTFAMCEEMERKLREHIEIEHKPYADFDPEISH